MSSLKSYNGSCFCGAVQITVTGEPPMGFCHCNSCRHWSAGPVNAFTLWQPENVKITQGAENSARITKRRKATEMVQNLRRSYLHRTSRPGIDGCLCRRNSRFAFIPGLHVNYGETKLHIRDGLLKLKDFPKGFGGSGIELPE